MKPKEKAEKLVEKMMLYSYEKIENENSTKYIVDNKIKKEHAIQCALIAVDEILNNVYRTPFRFTAVSSDELYRINEQCKHSLNMNILFLNSVKQEIEKL